MSKKVIIGRVEKINFPEWNLYGIDAKVDTGAYTSSLHCHHIEKTRRNQEDIVRFYLLDPSHEEYNNKMFELPVHAQKVVKSSNGTTEERYIVKTELVLAGMSLKAELSLTDRTEMRYSVLLGRKLLRRHFLIDPSKIFITKTNQGTSGR